MARRFRKRQLPDWIGSTYNPRPGISRKSSGASSGALGRNCDVAQGCSASSRGLTLTQRSDTVHSTCASSNSDREKGCRRTAEEEKEPEAGCGGTVVETADADASSVGETADPDASSIATVAFSSPPVEDNLSPVKETSESDAQAKNSEHLFEVVTIQKTTLGANRNAPTSGCTDSGELEKKKKKKKRGLLGPMKPKIEAVLSFEKAVSESLPLLKFHGEVAYTYSASECSALCEKFLSSLNADSKVYVGFDLEWTVNFLKGGSEKVALVQICRSADLCYLFHIAAMEIVPRALWQVLGDPRVVKVGLNIAPDMWKLERDYDDFKAKPVIESCVVELTDLANQKLKSSERWSLDGLCRNVLRHRLIKDDGVRCGVWHTYPLCDQQIAYAAADAYACYRIYQKLA